MKIRFIPVLLSIALFTSCNKDDDKDNDPAQTTQPSAPEVKISGTSASLIAISTGTKVDVPVIGSITQFLGTGVAFFNDGNGNTLDGGMVTCEGKELKFQSGSYFYQPSATDATGIDFGSSVDWSVAGKGSVPQFSYTYSRSVPEIGGLTATSTVKTSEDFTFGIDYTSNFTSLGSVDSVMYFVHGPKGSIHKTVAASVQSVTFSKTEMGTVGTGFGYAQAAAYNYRVETISGYKVAFVNEGVFTRQITLE